MSYVQIDDTAISSADDADVTAMKISRKVAPAPPLPNKAIAAYGSTSPAVTSAFGMRFGYVGNIGFLSRASAARPIVVAQSHGIANQLRPPMTYPGSASTGLAAIALL